MSEQCKAMQVIDLIDRGNDLKLINLYCTREQGHPGLHKCTGPEMHWEEAKTQSSSA